MSASPRLSRFLSAYGMVLVLLVLCAYYSVATLAEQQVGGAAGGEALAREVVRRHGGAAPKVVIVVGPGREEGTFAEALHGNLADAGATVLADVRGHPSEARAALAKVAAGAARPDLIAASRGAGRWALLRNVGDRFPALGPVPVVAPRSHLWPNFLKVDNLLNS